MNRTELEKIILANMADGKYDRLQVGNNTITANGETVTIRIEEGIPKRYIKSPEGELEVYSVWDTDEKKLSFVRHYGYLFWDQDIRHYLRTL